MEIIDNKSLFFKDGLTKRTDTNLVVLHHTGTVAEQSVYDIHLYHINNNSYVGIGYHFYIRKDGKVYTGRDADKVGAHCKGYNNTSIGICFEGNFDIEEMNEKQKESGKKLLQYINDLYGNIPIKKHSDLNATACCGKNFPFEEITKGDKYSSLTYNDELKDAYTLLADTRIMTDFTRGKDFVTRDELIVVISRLINIIERGI